MSVIFGGVNLEDIAAPRCFEIEERLRKELEIPVFHDDQHGTAVVVFAAPAVAEGVARAAFETGLARRGSPRGGARPGPEAPRRSRDAPRLRGRR